MKSRMEKLFDLLQLIEVNSDLKRIAKNWDELPAELRKILDKTLNGGIPRDKAIYHLSLIDNLTLCLAEYKDSDSGFTASYLVYGNDVLYVNES